MAEGAKLLSFPASGRSHDAGGGEANPVSSPPGIVSRNWVGDWPCDCGQWYRVLVEPLTFWPRNSATGFRTSPVERCVSCGGHLEETFALEAALIVLHLKV